MLRFIEPTDLPVSQQNVPDVSFLGLETSQILQHQNQQKVYRSEQLSDALLDFDQESLEQRYNESRRLLRTAQLLYRNGEYVLAAKLIGGVVTFYPHHPDLLLLMGECLVKSHQWGQARVCLSQLLEVRESMEAYYLLGEVAYEQGDFKIAKAFLEKGLEHINDRSEHLFSIYKLLGNLFVLERDFDAAEEYYNKAYTLNVESDTLLVNYGTLEIQKGEYDRALSHFRDAVKINSQNDKAWIGLALVHRQMGDFDLSWGNLNRALDVNPINKTSVHLLVEWGLEGYRYHEVANRLIEYMNHEYLDRDISLALARALALCGKIKEALIEIERTLLIDPNFVPAMELAQLLQVQNRLRF